MPGWKHLSNEEWNRRRREIEHAVKRAVYDASFALFEAGEHDGVMVGNGHHAAQNIAEEAAHRAGAMWDARRPPKPTRGDG